MISGIFHQGSGLGNQLHRYIMTRVLALDKGYEWGMFYNEDGSKKQQGFKGENFMQGDFFGKKFGEFDSPRFWQEKRVTENGLDIRSYDPEINFVEDNTIIDGEFQDERYFGHRMKEIYEWLKVEPVETDKTVIGFRGGEFAVFPELFLPKEYWDSGIKLLGGQFEVQTDDVELASKSFNCHCVSNVGYNWRMTRYANKAIVANSSFFILPRLLKHFEDPTAVTIAPRYWARYNTKTWALPQNYYKQFTYI